MRADDIIDLVLTAQANDDDAPIHLTDNVRLEPQIGYSGLMATGAYRGSRRNLRNTRPYVGLLDFKIFFENEGMRHESHSIPLAITELPIELVRRIHQGEDPLVEELSGRQIDICHLIQSAFVEQELNWGEQNFQTRTFFGRPDAPDELMREAAPRDYQMMYIERCVAAIDEAENPNPSEIIADILSGHRRRSRATRNATIHPPWDNNRMLLAEFRDFLPSVLNGSATEKWVIGHLDMIREICGMKGANPH